jgi:hypothetical protein
MRKFQENLRIVAVLLWCFLTLIIFIKYSIFALDNMLLFLKLLKTEFCITHGWIFKDVIMVQQFLTSLIFESDFWLTLHKNFVFSHNRLVFLIDDTKMSLKRDYLQWLRGVTVLFFKLSKYDSKSFGLIYLVPAMIISHAMFLLLIHAYHQVVLFIIRFLHEIIWRLRRKEQEIKLKKNLQRNKNNIRFLEQQLNLISAVLLFLVALHDYLSTRRLFLYCQKNLNAHMIFIIIVIEILLIAPFRVLS